MPNLPVRYTSNTHDFVCKLLLLQEHHAWDSCVAIPKASDFPSFCHALFYEAIVCQNKK